MKNSFNKKYRVATYKIFAGNDLRFYGETSDKPAIFDTLEEAEEAVEKLLQRLQHSDKTGEVKITIFTEYVRKNPSDF
jgi:hypothetical protein